MNNEQVTIAFVGGGNMAQAIIRGLINAGHPASRLKVSDPDTKQRAVLADIHSDLVVTDDNSVAISATDIVVLAVKPQIMATVAKQVAADIDTKSPLIISIAAGTTLASLTEWLGNNTPIVRVMPNQPALIGAGMSGLCATDNLDAANRDLASYVMAAAGEISWFASEADMDSVTAISGSGPAYFYLVMEILQEVAEEFGFDALTARQLSVQTALGASQVANHTDEELALLREKVTSPGGTTAAAIAALEAAEIRAIFRTALQAARSRSIELGQPKPQAQQD